MGAPVHPILSSVHAATEARAKSHTAVATALSAAGGVHAKMERN